MTKPRRNLLWILLLPAGLASPVWADAGNLPLQQLMQGLAAVSHIEAAFRDEKHSGILQFPLVTEGRFEYRAPAFIARRVSSPEPSLVEIDGDHIRLQRDGETTLIDAREQPMLADLLRTIRAILGGDLAYLQGLFTITSSGDRQHWQLQLKPATAPLSQYIELIEVAGHDRLVDTLSILEPGGDHTDTVFHDQQIR